MSIVNENFQKLFEMSKPKNRILIGYIDNGIICDLGFLNMEQCTYVFPFEPIVYSFEQISLLEERNVSEVSNLLQERFLVDTKDALIIESTQGDNFLLFISINNELSKFSICADISDTILTCLKFMWKQYMIMNKVQIH